MKRPAARSRLDSSLLACALLATTVGACTDPDPLGGFDATLRRPPERGHAYTLVSGMDRDHEIQHIAVAGDYLFFATSWQGVFRLPKYGGGLEVIQRDDEAHVGAMAANDTDVFWVTTAFGPNDEPQGRLFRRNASSGESSAIATGLRIAINIDCHTLLADEGHAYVLNEYEREHTAIDAVSLDGTRRRSRMILPPGPVPPLIPDFVAAYPHVYVGGPYWGELLNFDVESGEPIALSGANPLEDWDSVEAADEANIYAFRGERIAKIAKADMTVLDLYAAEPGETIVSNHLLADATDLYFLSHYSGVVRLRSVSKQGGPARDVGWGPQLNLGIWAMTQDAQFVVVATGTPRADDGNAILAFPKTPSAN